MSKHVIVTSIILSLALYEDITIEHKAATGGNDIMRLKDVDI